jgi:hypothetical protein
MKERNDKISRVYNYISRLANVYNNMGNLAEAMAVGEEACRHIIQSIL